MICENVKAVAEKKGITISELEERAGISKGSIYKWNAHSPTVANLKKVADVLGVTVNRLIRQD